MSPLEQAARRYLARKSGNEIPTGSRDKAGIWRPASGERLPCCDAVEPPRNPVFTRHIQEHCCGWQHVAAIHGVDPVAMRIKAAQIGQIKHMCPACKFVALPDMVMKNGALMAECPDCGKSIKTLTFDGK